MSFRKTHDELERQDQLNPKIEWVAEEPVARELVHRPSWQSIEGSAVPLGALWLPEERAFNFALYSKHATHVSLLFFREDQFSKPALQLDLNYLTNKSGRVWHCRVSEKHLKGSRFYAYQIDGPSNGTGFDVHAFDREKLLLDPYATEIFFPPQFDRRAAIGPGNNMGKAPLGVLNKAVATFDWGPDHVRTHEHDLVIYEVHIRGFTQNVNSGVADDRRGTYLGLIDKIPYLKALGITAVELLPVFQFDPQEGNYWGYMPLNFFAPHLHYASNPQNAANEFRTMVHALHAADIEVLLDVVFNHTVEGDEHGPCYSFRGIDNSSYYILTGDPTRPYANYSGTGNTLHTKNRHVGRMVLESLRRWVLEYHVDGFRFDLASVFNRHQDGHVSSDDSRLVAAIRADPVLANVRLIAEPWDASGLEELGRAFPGKRWFQWNGRYRDDIRRFVKGDQGFVAGAMRRLYGSDDLFPDTLLEACHPQQSLNYISSHDGFTLYDQVSYNQRNNWANGEKNQDGHRDNNSWNCGWEGDTNVPPAVVRLRIQQAKNFCCLLLLSNGTPMIRAGDEFLATQGGNNNPFNQDNEISWLDWDRLVKYHEFHRFLSRMIAFRRSHPTISRSRFWREDVRWYGAGSEIDWSPSSHHFAFFLDGRSQHDVDLYVMINAGPTDRQFTIQQFATDRWQWVVDTSRESPEDICEQGETWDVNSENRLVKARSIVVLTSKQKAGQSPV